MPLLTELENVWDAVSTEISPRTGLGAARRVRRDEPHRGGFFLIIIFAGAKAKAGSRPESRIATNENSPQFQLRVQPTKRNESRRDGRNGALIFNPFSVAPPGLDRFWNANPQLKLRAIVCRLGEAETERGRPRPQPCPNCDTSSPSPVPTRSATLLRPGTGALRPRAGGAGTCRGRGGFFLIKFLAGAKSNL
jgi:hypothetical protein